MRLALGLGLPYGGVAGVGVPGGSPASKALIGETDGLALSFVDDYFLSSTGHYGSARVKDTSTPANNYNSHPFGLLTYAGASPKLCRGPDGNLRYGAHNLILQSETLTASPWGMLNGGISETTAVSPPTGFSKVYKTSEGGTANAEYRIGQSSLATVNTARFVVIAKAAERSVILLGNSTQGTWFDLSNGSKLDGSVVITSSVEDLGNGWYKCTSIQSITTSAYFLWHTTGLGVSRFINGVPGAGIYIAAGEYTSYPVNPYYLATTSAARYELPYEWDENGDLLGIRVEEQRTNLFLNNREPETQDITVTAQAYTLSFYGTGSITLSGAHSDTLNGTGVNDRVTMTFTPSAGTLTCTVAGDIDWVQLEAGAFATSPIETAGSTVTRAGDNISLATSKFPVGATEGTLFAEYTVHGAANTYIVTLSDGTNQNMIILRAFGQDHFLQNLNNVENRLNTGSIAIGVRRKLAGRYKPSDYAACKDGGEIVTDTDPTSAPEVDLLNIGPPNVSVNGVFHLHRAIILPRPMTDTELQTLTGA